MAEPMRKGDVVRRTLLVEAGVTGAALLAARRRRSAGLAIAGAGAIAAWGAFSRNSRVFGQVVQRGSGDRPQVALTFDDGPGPSTAAILDALATARARATFFVLGRQAERYPNQLRRIVDEGHELASHGYDHGILVFRDSDAVVEQLRRTEEAVAAAVGDGVISRMFRAPHGFRGPTTTRAAQRAGYTTVGWTTGVYDSEQPEASVISDRVTAALAPGAIILLHDADGWDPGAPRDRTAEALPAICAHARQRGLEPVTLGALLAA